jgi:hypothetical protein
MTVNNELEWMWKDTTVTYLKTISYKLFKMPDEYKENPQSVYLVPPQVFEPDTSRIKSEE